MSEEKLTITQEMVDSFAEMIKSKNAQDVKFAVDILEKRDENDVESEKHFQSLAKLIISDNKLFPTSNQWIIKMGDKRLELKNNRSAWDNKTSAERALSAHLTEYLGKSVKNVSFSEYYNVMDIAKWKSTSPQDLQDLINKWKKDPNNAWQVKHYTNQIPYDLQRPSGKEYAYDPKFNKKEYIQKEKEKVAKNIGHRANWGSKDESAYFKAMKMVFGGGRELRDFLIKNKIVEIVQL